MPIRRDMYQRYRSFFIDDVNPFELASDTTPRGWRDAIAPMMAAFGIDTAEDLRGAWAALHRVRRDPAFPAERLREMETLFYAMPAHRLVGKDGVVEALLFSEEHYKAIAADTNRWRDPAKGPLARIAYTEFFRDNYRRIVDLAGR